MTGDGRVKTFFPKTRLAQLAARPGGVTREMRPWRAPRKIRTLRADCDAALEQEMDGIAAIFGAAPGGRLTDQQMDALLRHGDRIVTLAGTFGHARLAAAGRGLCGASQRA